MSVMEEQQSGRRRSFTKEFKMDAVALVLDEGRTVADVARSLGIGASDLGNWVEQARVDRGEREGLTTSEREELARLRRENTPVGDRTRSTQTSDGLLGEGVGTVTRYEWVVDRKAEGFPINMACDAAGVSRQAFYDWCQRREVGSTGTERFETELVAEMRRVHAEVDQTYGSPRMTVELRNRGWVVNHKRVERLMAVHNIVGVHKPARVRTTIPSDEHPEVPDLVSRRFAPGVPDVAWVGDITYVPTNQGWLYMATVIDLGSRRLLGYAMADHMRTELVCDALAMAAATRGGVTEGIIFHSDRGSQYFSGEYRRDLARRQIRQSVGRTGVCWDNSVAESFFGSLKREVVHRYRFQDRASARRTIFAWVNRYNTRRLHSSLGYLPPNEWEHQYHQTKATKPA